MECTGGVEISVVKETPEIGAPVISGLDGGDITYSPNQYLHSLTIDGAAQGTAMIANKQVKVEGSWRYLSENQVPQAGANYCRVQFVPTDSTHYNPVEYEVEVVVNPVMPVITSLPEMQPLVYGGSLGDAVLGAGEAKVNEEVIPGRFGFRDKEIVPTVSDSNSTQYVLIFLPNDDRNCVQVEQGVTIEVKKAENPPVLPPERIHVAVGVTWAAKVPLQAGWSLACADRNVKLVCGSAVTVTAVYKDTVNYKNTSRKIAITRAACVNHQYQSMVVRKATVSTTGVRRDTCKICGHQVNVSMTKLIPTAKKNVKKTVGKLKYTVTKAGKSNVAQVKVTGVTKKSYTSLTIPATVKINNVTCKVTAIDNKAFYSCKKLKKLIIKSTSIKKVGTNAVKGIYKKAVIQVPKSKVKGYKKLFTKKTGYVKTMKISK